MSETTSMTYYSTCENCDSVLEAVGEYHADTNTLYGLPCPKCGDEFTVIGWKDESEDE